jgi:hypothetical protein
MGAEGAMGTEIGGRQLSPVTEGIANGVVSATLDPTSADCQRRGTAGELRLPPGTFYPEAGSGQDQRRRFS